MVEPGVVRGGSGDAAVASCGRLAPTTSKNLRLGLRVIGEG
jgi:hypothetical protein